MSKILIADDEEAMRSLVARALTLDGHQTVTAQDGADALDILTRDGGVYDLLLTDIKMPIMDGIALALHVAAKYPDMIIVLMTGFADQRERAHGLDSLIYDVIVKPFTLTDLLTKIDDALAGKPVEVVSLGRRAREQ
jgi:two-component system cell cycle response regulator CpdR